MRLLLGLLFILTFGVSSFAQKQWDNADFNSQNRLGELGMPFTSYNTSQSVVAHEMVRIKISPTHIFSCFGVGWEANEKFADPGDFKVVYRTLEPNGTWSEWIEMEGEVSPQETPTGKYWTEAIFTHNAESHLELELSVSSPVPTLGLQIDLFDGNYQTPSMKSQSKKIAQSEMKNSRNCPAFPTIITRDEWCGGSAACSQVNAWYTPTYINATHVVMHHGASPNTYTDGEAVVRSYYNYHVNTLGWADIGYNYLIDKYGNFYQGRHNPNLPNSDVRGAHAGAANTGSIGMNFLGNLDVTLATPIQLQRLYEVLAWWFDNKGYDPLSSASMQTQAYGIQTRHRFTNHRDIGNTACPGNDMYARMANIRQEVKDIIDACNNVVIDEIAPETDVESTYDWRGFDFWTEYSDSDNPGGTGVDAQFYQVIDYDGTEWRANSSNGFFNDNFATAIHPDWTVQDGDWVIDAGRLRQNNESVGNSNMYAELSQTAQNAYLYQWSGRIDGTGTNRRLGLHFFVDNPTLPNRGNSYLAWFRADDNEFHLYKVENDVLNLVAVESWVINTNTWYDFKVTFNPQTGRIEAFQDNVLVASYTDPSPYTTGGYISLRNGDSDVFYDDLKVRISRSFQEKVTVGAQATKDARFESPNASQDACRINTIVKDGAGNWSLQNARQIYVDWTLPTTSSSTVSSWQTEDFNVDFTDEDNVDGSGIARRFYQVIDFDGADWRANAENGFFSDNFDQPVGIHPEWTVVNGSWNNTNGYLEQTDEALSNTNIYAFLKQDLSNRYLYNFQFKIDGAGVNKRGGFHYMCDDPTATNRGNSYFVWFRQEFQTLEFYRVSNDSFSQEKVYPLEFQQNEWMDIKIVYDRITGETLVYVDDKLVGDWRDDNPIQSGDYVSFRSGNSAIAASNFKVYRTRFPQVSVTVGSPSSDIRYENPDPLTSAAKVKSIVHDEAHNLSEVYFHDLNVDWTPPTGLNSVEDGLAADIDTFYTPNEISANWDEAFDVNSSVSHYMMSVGTTAGSDDVVAWTNVGNVTSNTISGLTLFGGETYYINVKAINVANLESDVIMSDGQYLDAETGLDGLTQLPFSIFPNPIQNEIQLQVNDAFQTFDAVLYALNGQVVWQQASIENTKGLITLPIQASIAKGMYVFELRTAEQQWRLKVLKE